MSHGNFATAINCMDGRTQLPVIDYMKNRYSVDYVDMITEPGPIRVMSENRDQTVLTSIKRRIEISISKHGSKHIAIVGHHDCAGNPVTVDTQIKQILRSIETAKSWNLKVEFIGLWIDEEWKINEVK